MSSKCHNTHKQDDKYKGFLYEIGQPKDWEIIAGRIPSLHLNMFFGKLPNIHYNIVVNMTIEIDMPPSLLNNFYTTFSMSHSLY